MQMTRRSLCSVILDSPTVGSVLLVRFSFKGLEEMSLPVGSIVATALNPASLPQGWLPCDGSPIPGQYAQLITVLGSSTTPNLIGRTLVGAGDLTQASTTQSDGRDPSFAVLGDSLDVMYTGGECEHQLSSGELPSHSHTINGGNFWRHYQSFEGNSNDDDKPFEINGKGLQIGGTDDAGQDEAHYNVQPYYAVTYMISAESE
jgi:microcystin-dependent protein